MGWVPVWIPGTELCPFTERGGGGSPARRRPCAQGRKSSFAKRTRKCCYQREGMVATCNMGQLSITDVEVGHPENAGNPEPLSPSCCSAKGTPHCHRNTQPVLRSSRARAGAQGVPRSLRPPVTLERECYQRCLVTGKAPAPGSSSCGGRAATQDTVCASGPVPPVTVPLTLLQWPVSPGRPSWRRADPTLQF